MSKFFYNISLPLAVQGTFTYSSDIRLEIGFRVLVDFSNRERIGVVIKKVDKPAFKTLKIKKVFDDFEIFNTNELALLHWISDYYHFPIGQVIDNFMPPYLRKANAVELQNNDLVSEAVPDFDLDLTSHQEKAFLALKQLKGFDPCLLYGVTGSGKTEIYIKLIQEQLMTNQSVLMLIPEISLAPQMVKRLKKIFGELVAYYHSGITNLNRWKVWRDARNGNKKIIIGTRSSVLMPLKNLGLIIVDEEHDHSYKQVEGLSYSARDVAIKRASDLKIPIILGSATPSLSILRQVEDKKFKKTELLERFNQSSPPKLTFVDINANNLKGGISEIGQKAILDDYASQVLSMVFINRRGFAPEYRCSECDWVARCNNCETNMVFHHEKNRLICHRCDSAYGIPEQCPDCGNSELGGVGYATESISKYLQDNTPIDRGEVYRFDSDTTKKKGALAALLKSINDANQGVIVGTQMLIKGHDFKKLKTVIVMNIDSGLTSINPSALEDLGQQLIQVSGRAGRLDTKAVVLVQTRYPDHPFLKKLKSGTYMPFAMDLLTERKKQSQPPYAYQALLKSSSTVIQKNINFLEAILKNFELPGCDFYGPMPASIFKVRGRYFHYVLLQANKRTVLHNALNQLEKRIDQLAKSSSVRWKVEIDPLNF